MENLELKRVKLLNLRIRQMGSKTIRCPENG